jgi:hypothetical protein
MYPATLGTVFATQVVKFVNDSEQRWGTSVARGDFELVHTDINGYDLSTLYDFFRTVKGQFDTTWDITVNGVAYTNCCLLSDTFEVEESKPGRYSVTLKVRQTV